MATGILRIQAFAARQSSPVEGVTVTVSGNGFTAIIVAWLAKFNTFYMMLISFLLIFLDRGASEIASAYSLNEYAADIITGIILFFILGCEFFINYKVGFRSRKKRGKITKQKSLLPLLLPEAHRLMREQSRH